MPNPSPKRIISIDQGTTSTRAILFDDQGREQAVSRASFKTSYPDDAWVEQNAEEIWQSVLSCLNQLPLEGVSGISITNQRETCLFWDRVTASPITPAVVWQCRRSSGICEELREQGLALKIREKTGLVVDPYFSGTKAKWLIENTPGLEEKVQSGEALFGTIDSWLLFKLTSLAGEPAFLTEPSNASRTMLFNINELCWDKELLSIFGLSDRNLARVIPSGSDFGSTIIDSIQIPIVSILGDQQASCYGLGCEREGETKCTFGTGAFLLKNIGESAAAPEGLLTTVGWQKVISSSETQVAWAIEGSVFMAGAVVDWLIKDMGLADSHEEIEQALNTCSDAEGLVVVPAFTGLGAPHWDEGARGLMIGLTRDTGKAEIIRATFDSIAHQVADLLEGLGGVSVLKIDGGLSKSENFCQTLADICQVKVEASPISEATAFGVAKLGAEFLGFGDEFSLGTFSEYQPAKVQSGNIVNKRSQWGRAVERCKGWAVSSQR